MNKRLLESEMKKNGDTGEDIARYLGISRQTFSAKINEYRGAEFTQGEINKIKEKYKLSPEEMIEIFFSSKVS